jgi:hypothetical protein
VDIASVRPTHGKIVQLCWVVDNATAAAEWWASTTGAGPFYMLPHIPFGKLTYRGQPAELDQSSAFGQWGAIQLELFEQHCRNPSGARDMFSRGQSGIQHMAWFAEDFEAEVARLNRLGFDTVMTAEMPHLDDVRIAWVDTRPALGVMVEVYEDGPLLRRGYRQIARAAENWDGSNPVREYTGDPYRRGQTP